MLARAFGVPATRVEQGDDPTTGIRAALSCPGPSLVEVRIPADENVLPMVAPGAGNLEMIGERLAVPDVAGRRAAG